MGGKSGNSLENDWREWNVGQLVLEWKIFTLKMSVKVDFSLSKEWNIVIKNPLSLLLECIPLKNVFSCV